MPEYELYRILKEELKNGSTDLVTRQSGQIIRERIEKDIVMEEDRSIIAIDFSGIGIVDYSCADEIVAKLVSRLLSNEYGQRYIVLKGLNEHQKENLEVALERKDLAVMALMDDGAALLLGSLNNYLKETLGMIVEKDLVTAKELSGLMKLEANTSGTRLLNLHKKRLVARKDEIRDGGRVWVYYKLV
jgi:hypothetical protein